MPLNNNPGGGQTSTGVYMPGFKWSPRDREWIRIGADKTTPKKLASSEGVNKNPEPAQQASSYVLDLQGNGIKAGAAIPTQYGRVKSYPDLIAKKLVEVSPDSISNYYLFCLGHGKYAIESLKVGTTNLSDITGLTYEIIEQGQAITLFPTVLNNGVLQYVDITNAGITDVPNPAYSVISEVAFWINFPSGLYTVGVDGSLSAASVTVDFEYATLDDNDIITGAWLALGTITYTNDNASAIADKQVYSFPHGRYIFRITRTTIESTDPRVKDRIQLGQITGYSWAGHGDYGDITILAVKTVSQNQPVDLQDNKVSVVSTRKIPAWNASWGAAAASRSIIWAIADAIKANYSAELGDEFLDLPALKALDDQFIARGDYFDARFDDPESLFSVIQKIAAAGRCNAFLHNGLLKIVRTEQQSTFKALFTPSNIIEGSFAISYSPPGYRQPDSLLVEYIDNDTHSQNSVECNYGAQLNEQTLSFFGVTTRDHAFREGMYTLAKGIFQHTQLNWATGLEALLLELGDVVLVANDVDNFAQWGVIYNTIGADKIVMSNPINFNAQSEGFIYISNSAGGVSDALAVTEGSSPYELILTAGIPGDVITLSADAEPSRYVFVTAVSSARKVRVTSISPNEGGYSITGMVEDDRVHTADDQTPPAVQNSGWVISQAADAAGSVIETSEEPFWIGNASMTFNGSDYFITWDANGYINFSVHVAFIVGGEEFASIINADGQYYALQTNDHVYFKAYIIPKIDGIIDHSKEVIVLLS